MDDGSFRIHTHATGHNVLIGPFTEDGQTVNSARLYIGSVNLTLTFAPDGIA